MATTPTSVRPARGHYGAVRGSHRESVFCDGFRWVRSRSKAFDMGMLALVDAGSPEIPQPN
jgi:hypothetical protein